MRKIEVQAITLAAVVALAWMVYSAYVVARIFVANYELVSGFAGWAP